MNAPTVQTTRLRIEVLPGLYTRLVDGLAGAGLGSAELNDLFARHIELECVTCGIRLSGEDLARIHLSEAGGDLDQPKLARLRQGYCARQRCDSYYYLLRYTEHPKLPWSTLAPLLDVAPLETADVRSSEGAVKLALDALPSIREIRTNLPRRVLVALGVLLVLLVWRVFIYNSGSGSFFQKARTYSVDPASAPTMMPE